MLSKKKDSAVQKLPDELGLGLLRLSLMPLYLILNGSEWRNMTRPEALAARAASRLPADFAAQRRLSAVIKGAASWIHHITRSCQRLGTVGNMQT
jgi:hypothetical protein